MSGTASAKGYTSKKSIVTTNRNLKNNKYGQMVKVCKLGGAGWEMEGIVAGMPASLWSLSGVLGVS